MNKYEAYQTTEDSKNTIGIFATYDAARTACHEAMSEFVKDRVLEWSTIPGQKSYCTTSDGCTYTIRLLPEIV